MVHCEHMMHLNQETLTRHIKSSFVLLLLHGNNQRIFYLLYMSFCNTHIGYNSQRSMCIAEIANVLQPKVDHSNYPKQIHHSAIIIVVNSFK